LVRIGDHTERRLTTAEVVDAYNDRTIEPGTYVWTDGMAAWQQLQAVDALVDALHEEAGRVGTGGLDADREGQAEAGANGSAGREDSTVFSLATLVQEHPSPKSSEALSDDSGLIDLAALTGTPAAPAERPSDALFADGLFFAAQVEPVRPSPNPPPPARGKQRPIIIGLSVAAAVLAGMLVFQVVRSHGATATTQPDAAATASGAPVAVADSLAPPTAAPSDTPAAEPADSAVAMAETKPPAAERMPPNRRQQPVGNSPPVSPPPDKSARPTTGACPCPEDDLMCQMRCAAKP